jgi:hypothetical protein
VRADRVEDRNLGRAELIGSGKGVVTVEDPAQRGREGRPVGVGGHLVEHRPDHALGVGVSGGRGGDSGGERIEVLIVIALVIGARVRSRNEITNAL